MCVFRSYLGIVEAIAEYQWGVSSYRKNPPVSATPAP